MTFDPDGAAPAVCGVTNTSWSTDFEPPTGRSRSRSRSGVRPLPAAAAACERRSWKAESGNSLLAAGRQHPAAAEVPGALPGRRLPDGRTGTGGRAASGSDPRLNDVLPFQYEKQKRDLVAVRKRIFEIVNFVNMVRSDWLEV